MDWRICYDNYVEKIMENHSSKALFFLRRSIRMKKTLEMLLVMSGPNPWGYKYISHGFNGGHINDIIVGFRSFRHEY